MGTRLVLNREPRVLIVGSLFIIVGAALFLDRLDVLSFRWDKLFWVAAFGTGGYLATEGFARGKKGRVFWGSLLFFFSCYQVLLHFAIIDRYDFLTLSALFLSFGFAFLSLFAHEPKEVGLLVPAFLLLGAGVVSILWWWELIEWYDILDALRMYWPITLILIGFSIMFHGRQRAQTGGTAESPSG